MIFKFIEIENEGHKIPLFFGKLKDNNYKNYIRKIENITSESWDGKGGKLKRFLKKFNFEKIRNITIDRKSSIEVYKTTELEFSIIRIKRIMPVYELLDYIKKDNILEYLICKQGNLTTYYILERR